MDQKDRAHLKKIQAPKQISHPKGIKIPSIVLRLLQKQVNPNHKRKRHELPIIQHEQNLKKSD